MTKISQILATAALALTMIDAASSAYAADAISPEPNPATTAYALPAGSYLLPGPAYILPRQSVNALLPARHSMEEMAEAERSANLEAARSQAWRRRWMISLAPLAAANILDASSSWGLRELNPALAGADGGFGMKAAGIKFGVVGGLIGAEYLLVRKYPKSAKFFSVVNYSTAGITGGLAVHNYLLPGR